MVQAFLCVWLCWFNDIPFQDLVDDMFMYLMSLIHFEDFPRIDPEVGLVNKISGQEVICPG
jgi:hypothetical protein